MAILSPSILAADVMNLSGEVKKIVDFGAKWVHIDVMDGNFVPNHSFSPSVVEGCRRVCDLELDVHLMIRQPVRYVEKYCRAGADYVSVHVESDSPENIHAALDKIRALGKKAGIVLKPGTPAQAAQPYLSKCDLILVMTVEPGFGGQKFMADMLPKLGALREMLAGVNPGCHLEVDGGVDLTTAPLCKGSGADVLVAGSAFFAAADRPAFVKEIEA